MRDGRLRAGIKRIERVVWTIEFGWRRWLNERRGRTRYTLGGTCRMCAKCCEAPSIRVGRILWFFPTPRRLFLWWQRTVNGFELVASERDSRSFVFRCTHFDPQTRRCDSYETRPFMCRDYPRLLLDQAWPELFEECGYRAVAQNGAGLREAIERTALDDDSKAALRRRLHLE